ncbi:MAG: PSD1 and planctomycete cytochrome C domain-containing protein [Planctomycetota bacterium]|jgi:hypothetical protein
MWSTSALLLLALAPGDPVDFAREVRPILAEHCFACHGPDAAARKADLRLDLEEDAVRDRGGYAVIDRSSTADSELLLRLHGDGVLERMPPESEPPLSAEEEAVLRRWIGEGAPWGAHWAFRSPERPELPAVSSAVSSAGLDPIDALVERRLAAEGLAPAPEADRHTLLRRVTLDLTGLPPTPEEIEAFVGDPRPDAFERVVDRLLASPRFGERMALQWLDVARYADTNGYSIDGGRHMWAWRDWVIEAFNANMPFDRFTVEQLAGDLLPDADDSTRIASGFNRNHMNTHEGGTIEEEYLVEYAADRVATTSQAWLGLTMGCARCHDHKYDPISQREYYRFFAYFNSITDRGNDGDGGVNSVPFIPVFSSEQRARLDALAAERAEVEAALSADTDASRARLASWVAGEGRRAADREPPVLGPWSMAGPFTAANGDEAYRRDFGPEPGPEGVDGSGAAAEDPAEEPVEWVLREDLADGVPHSLPTINAATYLRRTLDCAEGDVLELAFGSDDSIHVWWNGVSVLDANVRRGVAPYQEQVRVRAREGANELLVKVVNYTGPGGVYFQLASSGLPAEVREVMALDEAERSDAQRAALAAYHRSIDPALDGLRGRLEALGADAAAIEASPRTTAMVMEERAMRRPAHVLMRGVYDQKGDEVQPGTPSILPPLPADARPDRLGLAEWLVRDDHPLTARVAVNGYWQLLFGAGLVDTPEDFGVRGALPSHPELLDLLAVDFVESGWDVKGMLRRMVLSAAYRRDSSSTPELLARDPENRLLARGPRFRLQAELIRDLALSAGGLLSPRIGGPSGRPYQPDGLWREMSHFGSTPATEQVYVQDHGEGLYRRGMYTIWKRTVPPPTLAAFDAPSREVCVVRRSRTNTPLQALVLLNETGFVEASRAIAQRVLLEGGADDGARGRYLFLLVLGREPGPADREVLAGLLARERARFAARGEDAAALLEVGESPRDGSLDPSEHAAWTLAAALVLNLSEAVTRE